MPASRRPVKLPGQGTNDGTTEFETMPESSIQTGAGTKQFTAVSLGKDKRLQGRALGIDIVAVMTSSAATGVLGFAFWTVAARGYDTAEVGRASAIISSATFIAILANFSLGSLYERFLPVAGGFTQRLVRQGTLFAGCVGVLFGAAFLVLGPRTQLFPNGFEAILFPLFVAVLAIYVLQDQVLIGLGRARTIATKNISQSVAKLIAVAALIPLASGAAIVGSWVAPAAVITAIVSFVVIRRETRRRSGPPRLPPTREVLSFFASSYAISAVTVSVPLLVPLIVVAQLGTEMNAYFSMCWLVVHTLGVLIGGTAAPFIATASTPGADLRTCTTRFVLLCVGAAVAGGAVLMLAGPWILAVLGPDYVDQGAGLIRIMALTLPAVALMTIYTALARLRRRLRLAVTTQIVLGVTVVLGVTLTTPHWGLNAVGYSYLAAEAVSTLILLAPTVALLRRIYRHADPHPDSAGPTALPASPTPVGTPPTPTDRPVAHRSVGQRFAEVVATNPDRTALWVDGAATSYRALGAAAAAWANAIRPQTSPGAVLPLIGDLDADTAAVILGGLTAGIPLVPLDSALPANRVRHIMSALRSRDHRPDVVVLGDDAHPGWVDRDQSVWRASRPPEVPPAVSSTPEINTVTSIQFTSGSSGDPKAVLHKHGTWLSDWILHRDRFGIVDDARVGLCMPVSFAAGLNVLIGCLLSGAEVIVIDPRRHPVGRALVMLDDADIVMCTPSYLQALAATANDAQLAGVRRIVVTGEPVYGNVFTAARAIAPNAVLTNWVGSSETLGIAHFDIQPTDPVPTGAIPAGLPVPHKKLGVDATGRLTVTSAYLAAGYLDPQSADTAFVENPDGTATFVTNDRARINDDGSLTMLGRMDAAVKVRGYLVEPAEVEAALLSCPGIREALVVANHRAGNPVLIGYAAPEPGLRVPATAEVRAHLRAALPDWMVPAHVVLLDALPRNDRGKVDRRALPAPARGPINPASPGLEAELAETWAVVLRLDQVGRDENLYALGGDSLTALELVTAAAARYRVRLRPSDLAAAPTVAQFAAVLRSRQAGGSSHADEHRTRLALTTVPLRRPPDARRTVFCFAGAGASALSFAPFADRVDEDAVVVFEPHGLPNRAFPDWTVNRAADRHLKDLLALQPDGPYTLVGHSLGAFIALAAAERLHRTGHHVELVTLLDPILPPRARRPAESDLRQAGAAQPGPELAALWRDRLRLPLAGWFNTEPRRKEAALREVGVRVNHLHRPRPYPGRTLLVLSDFNAESESSWTAVLTGEVTSRRLGCDHNSIIREPYVGRVAELMAATLSATARS